MNASRGKAVRAEPVAAMYEQGKIHHVGRLDGLENEMITWQPGISSWSPNRIDALVWVLTELMLGEGAVKAACYGYDPPSSSGRAALLGSRDSGEDWWARNAERMDREPIWERDVGRGLFYE